MGLNDGVIESDDDDDDDDNHDHDHHDHDCDIEYYDKQWRNVDVVQ